MADWTAPFETLRAKWGTIPLSDRRARSADLLQLEDDELLTLWRGNRDSEGAHDVRGWYRLLYADTIPGKKILDIGCGFAYDSLTFAEQGAQVTLVDIVDDNVTLAARVAKLLGLDVQTIYMESVASLAALLFDEWGPQVDGPGTPWEEWYDVPKLLSLLAPAKFDTVFYHEWHNNDFNWFDLVLRGHEPITPIA